MNLFHKKLPIFHLLFPNQYLLTSTFLRFQEHYESPEFKGKIFSLGEFADWYAERKGDFTYYFDRTGFNIPSHVLKPFRKGKFNPLSSKERVLMRALSEIKEDRFYVIATINGGDKETVRHKILHALLYLFPKYSRDVTRTVKDSGSEADMKKVFVHHFKLNPDSKKILRIPQQIVFSPAY